MKNGISKKHGLSCFIAKNWVNVEKNIVPWILPATFGTILITAIIILIVRAIEQPIVMACIMGGSITVVLVVAGICIALGKLSRWANRKVRDC